MSFHDLILVRNCSFNTVTVRNKIFCFDNKTLTVNVFKNRNTHCKHA